MSVDIEVDTMTAAAEIVVAAPATDVTASTDIVVIEFDEVAVDSEVVVAPVDTDVTCASETVVIVTGGKGEKGDPGEPGEPGSGSTAYTHEQITPAALWTITHGLGFYPNVTVVDSAGSGVEGEVVYLDMNSLTVTFTSAFGGFAYLS